MSWRGRSDPGKGSGPPRYPGSFLLAFREALAGLGWELRRLVQDVAHCHDADGKEHLVGVENLYRRARRTPRDEWPELIAEFLRTVSTVEESGGLPEQLAAAADQLLFRLGQPLKLSLEDARVWQYPLAGTDLVVNLVIDYPNRMCYVTEQLVADSGQPGQEWLARARANLLARTPPDCFQVIHEESGLRMCGVADAYDSSRALLLDELLPATRGDGYLVVVPGRDELLVMPVCMEAVPHMHLLKILAEKNYKNAPYPISAQVYWVRDGEWQRFPIEIRNQNVTVEPPAAFVEVLNRLRPPESGEDAADAPTEQP